MLGIFLVLSRKRANVRHVEVTGIMLCYRVRWEVVSNDAANGVRESPGFNFGFIWWLIRAFIRVLFPPFLLQRLFQNSFQYRDTLALLKNII